MPSSQSSPVTRQLPQKGTDMAKPPIKVQKPVVINRGKSPAFEAKATQLSEQAARLSAVANRVGSMPAHRNAAQAHTTAGELWAVVPNVQKAAGHMKQAAAHNAAVKQLSVGRK
jgi:hypothetical protein